MPKTRKISGEVAFPRNATKGVAHRVVIELRDVSMQDQASAVLATTLLHDVVVGPDTRVSFALTAPLTEPNRSLALRVQVDMQAGQSYAAGDYLSTVSNPVPAVGDANSVVAAVTKL
jgi:hypothetical protein